MKYSLIIVFMITVLCVSCKAEKKAFNAQIVRKNINQIVNAKSEIFKIDSRKPMAWGHEQTIYVFADSDVWKIAEPYLRYSLERDFYTTENEQLFDVKLGELDNIEQFNRFKNLIFIGDLSSNKKVSQYVKNIMNEQAIASVQNRKSSMFLNNNLWANDQMVLFLMATNANELKSFLHNNTEIYFNMFKERFINRIVFKSQKLDGYKDSFFKEMPFKIYIPETYRVFKRDLDNNFISFLWRSRENQEDNPDKYISIYWENATENPIDDKWLIEKRKDLAWKYYDEDEFNIEDTIRGQREIGEKDGWFLFGRWQNKKYYMGGAFRSYAVYDEVLKIAYLIDTSVYFPAGYKIKYLLELEGIVETIILKESGEL
ncbi:MAG: DUF4837 family protein [Candidatus Cloacimonetes bacterium]|nr:DUF4837 family protein [Candidatus Cloacimonadota bacterium]MDD4156648.1 DUF4837 family protein [Candidatus Cloacimonadota bacterium]